MPVVPGSALKGRARHECEKIVRALTGRENSVCHGPRPETMCPLDPPRLKIKQDGPCPVCSIFGSPWFPSSVSFSDLVWELRDEFVSELPPDPVLRSGVSVARSRRVAADQKLFTMETFDLPGAMTFIGRISGDLPDDSVGAYGRLGLLAAGLRAVTGFGGGRSRGLGWCSVAAKPVELREGGEMAIDDALLKENLMLWFNLK